MVWDGRDVKDHLVPTPVPWWGTASTRPDRSKLHPTWPWKLQGRGHPQLLWELPFVTPFNVMDESLQNGKWCLLQERKHVYAPAPSRDLWVLSQFLSRVLQIGVNTIRRESLQCRLYGYCGVLKSAEFRASQRIIQSNIQRIMSRVQTPQQTESKSFICSSW